MNDSLQSISAVVASDQSASISTASNGTLTRCTLVLYGSLALPLCLAEIPIILYLPAFYAQELRLSSGMVGAVFLLARLWDGLSDILVGWLSDRSLSRFGRRKPWVVFGAPCLMVSTWFLCNPPASAGLAYLSIWAGVFYSAFTAVKIPHLSWGTELATEYVQRSRVTTFREAFTMLGNLLFVSVPLILLPGNARLRDVIFLISLSTLIAVPLAAVPLGTFVRDPGMTHRLQTPLLKEMATLLRDRVFLRFVLGRLIFATEEGVANSLLVFTFGVGLQLPDKIFSAILILYLATLTALPVTLSLAKRVEKHHILAGGVALQATVYGMALLVPSGKFIWVAILWVVLGVGNTAMLSLPTSILADIIDYGQVRVGERHSGAYVAVDNLVYKIGMALGVGMSFGALALLKYDPAALSHNSADVESIRILGLGVPCLLSALAFVPYWLHPITRKLQRKIRKEIETVCVP